MVQAIELAGMQHGKTIAFFGRNLAAGQHDAVIRIAADDKSLFGIQDWSLGAAVEGRQKLGQASPTAVPGRPDRVPDPVLDGELLVYFPTVLREPVEGRRHPRRARLSTQLGIIAEQAQ